jgi:hypothetical protein
MIFSTLAQPEARGKILHGWGGSQEYLAEVKKIRAAAPRVYLIPLSILSGVAMNKSNIPQLKF